MGAGQLEQVPPPSEPSLPLPGAMGEAARTLSPAGWTNITALIVMLAGPFVLAGLVAMDVIRPGSFKRHKPVMPSEKEPVILLCAGMIVFASSAVGYSLAYSLALPFPAEVSSLTVKGQAVLQAGSYLVGVPVALVMAVLACGGMRRMVGRWDGPIGVGLVAAAYTVVSACSAIAVWAAERLSDHAPNPIAHETLRLIKDEPASWPAIVMSACAVIGAPIVEEVVYRLFLQTTLLKVTRSPWLSVILTAALFAGRHTGVVPWHALPPLFVLGLAFGIAFARTGRLGVPIVMHAAFNAGNIALTLWGPIQDSP
ncbi:MAG: CPBP family intramembrane glutamic endopeptidase [Planctomycetota bacterium]